MLCRKGSPCVVWNLLIPLATGQLPRLGENHILLTRNIRFLSESSSTGPCREIFTILRITSLPLPEEPWKIGVNGHMSQTPNIRDEVHKLVAYIEENLRASSLAGLNFIDTRNLKGRLTVRQNHVVFGRRGAGKSSLVKSVCGPADHVAVRINLEGYKDISFPNILLRVLKASCAELDKAVKARSKWWQFLPARRFRQELRKLEKE